jgi:hypothetical protein
VTPITCNIAALTYSVNSAAFNLLRGHAASSTADNLYWRIEANSGKTEEYDLPFEFTPADCKFYKTYTISMKKKDTVGGTYTSVATSMLTITDNKLKMTAPIEPASFKEAYYEVTIKANKLYDL